LQIPTKKEEEEIYIISKVNIVKESKSINGHYSIREYDEQPQQQQHCGAERMNKIECSIQFQYVYYIII